MQRDLSTSFDFDSSDLQLRTKAAREAIFDQDLSNAQSLDIDGTLGYVAEYDGQHTG